MLRQFCSSNHFTVPKLEVKFYQLIMQSRQPFRFKWNNFAVFRVVQRWRFRYANVYTASEELLMAGISQQSFICKLFASLQYNYSCTSPPAFPSPILFMWWKPKQRQLMGCWLLGKVTWKVQSLENESGNGIVRLMSFLWRKFLTFQPVR